MGALSKAWGRLGQPLARKALNCAGLATAVWAAGFAVWALMMILPMVWRPGQAGHVVPEMLAGGLGVAAVCAAGLLGGSAVVLGGLSLARERPTVHAVLALILGVVYATVTVTVLLPGL